MLLERTLALCSRLHQLGRGEELGNVLSTFNRSPPPSTDPLPSSFQVGDNVTIQGLKGIRAVVKWVGPTHWDRNEVIGLEIPPQAGPVGTSDGLVEGIRYFHCVGGALFINQQSVGKLEKEK